MGEIIIKNAVVRKPGYLYYIDGNGSICEAKMGNKKKVEDKKEEPKKVIKK